MVRQAALDLITNIHIEMMRVRGIEVPGHEPDEHELSEIHSER
jgi:UDP-glucose 6-dehydrogenase